MTDREIIFMEYMEANILYEDRIEVYSGRGMFGQCTTGYEIRPDLVESVCIATGCNRDNLGYNYIVYIK